MMRTVLLLLLALPAWLAGWTPACQAAAAAGSVTRDLPAHYVPGSPLTVSLSVVPGPEHRVQAVEEAVPEGWTVGTLSHGAVFDPVNRKVKWGPFLDTLSRTLTYQATPPAGATGAAAFVGTASFDGQTVPVAGDASLTRFPGTLSRTLPDSYRPGAATPVTLLASPAAGVVAWAVEERVPEGWAIGAITSGGVLDPGNRKIKWGPFFDTDPRSLSYLLTPPPTAREAGILSAVARYDEAVVGVEDRLPVAPSALGRKVPATYTPEVPFEVVLMPEPASHIDVVTVEEQIPAGWTPVLISGGGTFDAANLRVKWGPYLGAAAVPAALSYRLTPPPGSRADLRLEARARFDSVEDTDLAVIPRFLVNPESTAVRTLPAFYVPGTAVPVSILATPIDLALVFAVEEEIPEGWTVSEITHGGTFDPVNRRVKWGPFLDGLTAPRTLAFSALPPAGSRETVRFSGVASFDGEAQPVTGPETLGPRPSTAVRTAPGRYTPGIPFRVTLALSPSPDVVVQALEEAVPEGWAVEDLTDGGSYDSRNRKLKWGPFTDAQIRSLSFVLTPPAGFTGLVPLSGTATFDRAALEVTGPGGLEHNAAPSASEDALTRRAGEPAKFLVSDLLANDSDPESDFLDIRAVDPLSAQGASVRLEWPWVLYQPGPGVGDDAFTYTVSDPYGGTATGTARIRVTDPGTGLTRNILSIELLDNPVRTRITWVGIPGRLYRVQATESLAQPVTWTTVGSVVAGVNGVYVFTDPSPSAVLRFYRALSP